MKYRLEPSSTFKRSFRKLDKSTKKRVLAAIEKLADDPYNNPHVRLAKGKFYKGIPMRRLRVGNYRVFFAVVDDIIVILLIDVRKKKGKTTYRF